MSNKVGLLLPRSVIYPSMGFDMLGAVKCALAEAGISDIEIKTENIGIAGDDKLNYSACEKLLFDGCSIVAGYVNPLTAEKLQVMCSGANAIFLHLDAGYHYPSAIQQQHNLFTISLQGVLGCRLAAVTAVAEGGKAFAFTGSFYDAGYRSTHGFHRGLEDAGGSITFNHITKLKRADFTLAPLAEHLRANPGDGLLAAFCGDMMQDLFAAMAADSVFANHSVSGSPFMGDEVWLGQSVYPGMNIKVCVPWTSRLQHDGNKHFMKVMADKKVKTNLFSVLGWEAGQVMAVALAAGDTDVAVAKLEGLQYTSPRGTITIDAATHQAYAPMYEAWVKRNDVTEYCVLEPVSESPYTEQQRKKLEEDINNFSGPSTSWQNAYACLDS
jgi:branched-chain amino acid transport system substrate-binding protein